MSGLKPKHSLVLSLFVVHTVLLLWGAWRHSFSWTEAGLLASGILHWRTGSFESFRVTPPLFRMFATLPVLAMKPSLEVPERYKDPRFRPEWELGADLVRRNAERSLSMIRIARWSCIPFSLLGAWVCYQWATEYFGSRAGLLALTLWCFSPEMIAYGQMASGDSIAAALGVTAMYVFRRWIVDPTLKLTIILGGVVGVAILAKTTWIILFGLVPLLWFVSSSFSKAGHARRKWYSEGAMLGVSVATALFLINISYGFSGSCQRLGDYVFLSKSLNGDAITDETEPVDNATHNRFFRTVLHGVPVPFPRDFVLGVDLQKWDMERPRYSYLRGQWRIGGWWYYYAYALAVKLPLGNWVLAGFALYGVVSHKVRLLPLSDELFLALPIVIIFAVASSQTGLNKHSRYILPLFPFAFIWVSRVASINVSSKIRPILLGIPIGWMITSSLWSYPHSLSYFNETVGGPINGFRHLNSSNIHWGGDLLFLKDWYDDHPNARPFYVAYSLDAVDPSFLWSKGPRGGSENLAPYSSKGVSWTELKEDSWIAIDVAELTTGPRNLEVFNQFPQVAMAGYGFRIFHLSATDSKEIVRQLSLRLQRL